jgi:aspartyl-tRNA(Asn)/glutamyl-tRNA(Gln) amidotransferase subunit B
VLAAGADPKKAANWVINEVFARLNKTALGIERIGESKLAPQALAELIKLVDAGTINNNAAKTVLESLFAEGGTASDWVKRLGLEQTQDLAAITAVIDKVLAANPAEVARYCGGDEKVYKFLVGLVMKEGRGKFPAEITQKMLSEKAKATCP